MSDSGLFRVGQPMRPQTWGWDAVPDTRDVRPDYSFKVEECSIPEGVLLKDCRGPKSRRRWWR